MTNRRWHWFCVALIGGVYGISFLLPTTAIFTNPISGWATFQSVSYLLVAYRPRQSGQVVEYFEFLFTWMANPLLWAGLVLLAARQGWAAFGVGLAAFGCAAIWFFLSLPTLDNLFVGYYVWLTSTALLAVSGFWAARSKAHARRTVEGAAQQLPPPDADAFALFRTGPPPSADAKGPHYSPLESSHTRSPDAPL
jgi:hypothetical protein